MFSFCSMCSDLPQSGQYAYEAFRKVPQITGIIQNVSNLIGGGNKGLINNISNIANIANNFSNIVGVKPQIGNIGGINLNDFINNLPLDSIKATDSNLQEIVKNNEGAVIKKIMKSNYNDLIKKHKQTGQKFTDPDFPPDQKSIGNVQDLPVKASWRRIPEVIKNYQFISQKIQPSDILQGSIGDCYFLSAISALAQNDFRIKNLFPNLQINPYGIYMARILYQGVLRQIVVDDYIPVTPQGTPLFAKPSGGRQIWVMILQKCWAKLNGSYGSIVGGLPNQVLHAFSGAPTLYKSIPQTNKEKQEALWNEIIDASKKGAILCCGTKGEASVQKAGLVLGHAYSLLGVYDTPYRLMKIRNPWGKRQWNGRVSQQDFQFWNSLSQSDKQKLNYKKGEDGIFFMLWDDFVNYFDMVDICKINDNASYTNVESQFDKKNGQIFEFQTSGGNIWISLSQQCTRGLSEAEQKRGYARSTLVVSKNDQASKGYQYKYVDSSSSKQFSEHVLELNNLPQGKYVIFAKFDWIRINPDSASVSVYTESQVSLKKSKQSNHDGFLYKTFLDHARKNVKQQNLSDKPRQWICSDFLLNKGGYGYIALHLDQDSKRKIGIQIDQKQYIDRRLVLKKPYKGQGIVKTMVEPGKQLIILFRMKANNYPSSITLPTPKIYNLV